VGLVVLPANFLLPDLVETTWRVSVSNPRRKNKTRSRFGTVSRNAKLPTSSHLCGFVNSAQGRVIHGRQKSDNERNNDEDKKMS